MKAKTCQYCCNAKEASAGNRTVLICTDKQGCEGKYFVVGPEDGCGNFKASQTPLLPEMEGARYIPLTKGKFAIVDAEDYPQLSRYKWHCRRSRGICYAYRREAGTGRSLGMHRQILGAPEGVLVDHIDGDGLNNRKRNLRLCSAMENSRNRRPRLNCRSRYKGISLHKRRNKWEVNIAKARKNTYLGGFDDQIEAAVAYDRKAEVLFGEFAYLNFPQLVEFRRHLKRMIYSLPPR